MNENDLIFAWQVSLLSSGIYILSILAIAITHWSYIVKFVIATVVIKASISHRRNGNFREVFSRIVLLVPVEQSHGEPELAWLGAFERTAVK